MDSESQQISSKLPESTLSLIFKTLTYYNTLNITQVYVFTQNLQLVGSIDITKSTPIPLDQCIHMGHCLRFITNKKLNHIFELNDDNGNKLICHTIDEFVFLYGIE